MRDLHILKAPVSKYQRNERYAEAASVSFRAYVERFLLPELKRKSGVTYGIEEMNRESSLYRFGVMLSEDPSIFVVHTQDDFLLKADDLAWLSARLGPRLTVFPYGGHCGEINFPQFDQLVKQVFPAVSKFH